MAEYIACAEAHISARRVLRPDPIFQEGRGLEEVANNAYWGLFPLGFLLEPIINLKDMYRTDLPHRDKVISREEIIYSYDNHKNLWADRRILWEVSCLLLNVETNIEEPVAITNNLTILPFPAPEKNDFWQRVTRGSSAMGGGIGTVSAIDSQDVRTARLRLRALAYTNPEDKELPNTDDIISEMWHLMTALRLVKAGEVFTSRFVVIPVAGEPGKSSSFSLDELTLHKQSRWPYSANSRYLLNFSDLPRVKEIFSAMTLEAANRDHHHLQVGTTRFNTSYGRISPEDKIIDMAVALESLLLWDVREELKYRLSLRGAALLAMINPLGLTRHRLPRETQSALKRIYDTRSGIVHNGKTLTENEKDVPGLCESILRDVLCVYLYQISKGKSIASIRQEVDDIIIDRLMLEQPDAEKNRTIRRRNLRTSRRRGP